MYKPISSDDFYKDINSRKEFVYLKGSQPTAANDPKFFEFSAPQRFVRNYFNPSTNYKRILIKHGTGLGKTNTALAIAREFVRFNRPVIIIGFTIDRFKEELLKFPEFGYVTEQEVAEQDRLFRLTLTNDPDAIKNYRDYIAKLKRRFRDYTFYGYKVFSNRIFDIKGADEPKINFDLIETFRHGVIICDEIHNVYNSIEQNNWGKAIQFVLNVLGPDIYCALLSATPINNPNEINDLLNLLHESEGYNLLDLMTTPTEDHKTLVDKVLEYNPGELIDDNIEKLTRGKVSFMPDLGSAFLPKRIIEGESIPGIKYLKFIRCEMSPAHYAATQMIDPETNLPIKKYFLRDVGFDMPPGFTDFPTFAIMDSDESDSWKRERGIQAELTASGVVLSGPFMKRDMLAKYSTKYVKVLDDIVASKGKVMVYHHTVRMSGVLFLQNMLKENNIIGENDHPDFNTLCSICSRKMSDDIHTNGHKIALRKKPTTAKGGDEDNSDNNETELDNYEQEWQNSADVTTQPSMEDYIDPATQHQFRAMRFLIVYSDIEKHVIKKILNKYNSASNKHGYEFKVLLGSRVMKEGYDVKAVRNLFVLTLPINIPTLIQVFGRAVRTRSHELLPPDQRNVKVRIYTSMIPKGTSNSNTSGLSTEETDYNDKMLQYLLIQRYERIMNKNAIDAHITEAQQLIDQEIAASGQKDESLGALPFSLPKLTVEPVKNTTYLALEHYRDEVNTIVTLVNYIININYQRKIWKFDELWEEVRKLPGTPNPQYYDIKSFAIALKIIKNITIIDEYIISTANEIDSFARTPYNPMEIITINTEDLKIKDMIQDIEKNSPTAKKLLDVILFYEKYYLSTHLRIMRKSIEVIVRHSVNRNGYAPRSNEEDSIIGDFLTITRANMIIKYYSHIFSFVTAEQIKQPNLTGVIGYRFRETTFYFSQNKWHDFIYVEDLPPENPILVGIYSNNMLFKIRDPITDGKEEDRRKIQRGAVCGTKSKPQLVRYAKLLEIDMKKVRIAALCDVIKQQLLLREQERRDGQKWVYLF